MPREGITHHFDYLNLLTEEKVDKIHKATIRILEERGVQFHNDKALRLYKAAGCKVDETERSVKIPEELVAESLKEAASSFEVRARSQKNHIIMDSKGPSYTSPGSSKDMLDLQTGKAYPPSRKEFYDYIKLLDYLDGVDWQAAFPFNGFEGVPPCMQLLESGAAKIRMSSKAIQEGSVLDNHIWNYAMGKATGQDIMQLVNPTAPLVYYQDAADRLVFFCENDIPFCICSGPMMGATAPVSIAGAVATNNADALAGIVLAQLIRPAARLNTVSLIISMNMMSGTPAFGDVGNYLAESAFNQMWRYYGIPCTCSSAAWTSSKEIDFQAGYELSMGLVMMALTGATNISFVGSLTAELTAHPFKAIIDNDVINIVKRYMKGIDVTGETLAVDEIVEVGFAPGNFMMTDNTLMNWRNDIYMPEVADRLDRDAWLRNGKKNAIDHAKEKYETILSEYKPESLSAQQEQELEYILRDARRHYRKAGLIGEEEWTLYQKVMGDNLLL